MTDTTATTLNLSADYHEKAREIVDNFPAYDMAYEPAYEHAVSAIASAIEEAVREERLAASCLLERKAAQLRDMASDETHPHATVGALLIRAAALTAMANELRSRKETSDV